MRYSGGLTKALRGIVSLRHQKGENYRFYGVSRITINLQLDVKACLM